MDDPTPAALRPELSPAASPRGAASPAVHAAARWFTWIAALSLINIVLSQTGAGVSFVVGLGITAIIDAAMGDMRLVGYLIEALVIGFFFGMGRLGLQGRLWAFVLGAAVYVLDALIYVRLEAWLPVAFHCLALFYIGRGIMALRSA